ncbi:MAG: ATP-dependent nuclease subunit B-like protein [Solirubrobacterales bacterium]|nr:ATP-dependent nuclease subunit B-like protein [Solirubrobacterales bacterium]
MPISLVTGPANAGKAQVLMDAVRRHLAHGQEPMLVVPTRADVQYYLRELAGGEAAMGVRVAVFADLIEELVSRAGVTEPALSRVARERLIATLVSPHDRERRPGFARALGELFAELQTRRVEPRRLAAALGAAFGDGGRALGFDLGAIYGEYHRQLQRLGRLDEPQRALLALDRLRERPSLWGATPVLFYGFDDLTQLQLDAIETLGRIVDAPVTVSLAYEPGRTAFAGRAATFQALAPLAEEHHQLEPRDEHYAPGSRAVLAHLERGLFEPATRRADPAGVLELMQGGGERAELELVARRVAALLEEGVPAEEIAVIIRHPAAAAALVTEVFTAAGIPFAMPVKRPFGDTSVGRALIGLLRCVGPPGGVAPGTPADLLAWLRAPGRLDRPELADWLEREVRRHGIRRVEQARARWEERWFPLETIDRLAEAASRGPAVLAERAGRELVRLFAAPRRGRAHVLGAEEMDEARALAGGRSALAELRELARFAPEAAPASAGELAAALAGIEVNSGELPGPGLVAVLDPLQLRARRVRALFLTGLQEGVFPLRARPQPLLGERERSHVAKASGLLLGESEDVLAAERYLLYAVLSRPEERLVLSWHETDDDAGPLSRSLFVDDVCDLFDERLSEQRERRALGALDAIGLGTHAEPELPDGGRLTDERVLRGLRDRVWSATSIEKWVGCPVAWFVERLLGPDRFDPDPEPFARGSLAHEALNRTFARLGEETGSTRVTSRTLEPARTLLRQALAEAAPDHLLSVSPERARAIGRALAADLERYLEYAAGLESSLAPREFELAFGPFEQEEQHGEPSTLPAFELGGGVRLRGRIDRIDVAESGEAIVIDYKGADAPRAQRWLADGKLQVALYMQAAEQLLDLRVVGGLYQPLRGEKIQARGVVLAGHEAAADCTRTDRFETDELDELLAAALDAARDAAGEAGRGELEPRPASCAWNGGCQYPTICRCER